jgi:hypothetical protein
MELYVRTVMGLARTSPGGRRSLSALVKLHQKETTDKVRRLRLRVTLLRLKATPFSCLVKVFLFQKKKADAYVPMYLARVVHSAEAKVARAYFESEPLTAFCEPGVAFGHALQSTRKDGS